MKKLFLILLLLCLLVQPVFAAWEHTGTGTGIALTLNNGTATNLPATAWTLSGWIKVISNVGTGSEYFIGTNVGITVNPGFNFGCNQASEATGPGKMEFRVNDDDTTDTSPSTGTNAVCNTTTWQLVTIVKDTSNVKVYFGTTQEFTTGAVSIGTVTIANPWLFFSRINTAGIINGAMCDWAKWDRAFSTGEIASRNAGFTAKFFPTPTWCMDMIRNYIESCAGLTVTNTSTTVSDCPPLYYPN